ncbi:GNAT family N-acetyltransferase [Candidatus Microgenomates bacterium]|nr:GNAT family N-acetyltransferase [Candidatus Microgenomates bacterium]
MMTRNYEALAKLYADVFAGPPWNEFTQDKEGCGQYFGLNTAVGQKCPSCAIGKLDLAYPLAETKQTIEQYLAKPGARLLTTTVAGDELVGFAWAYDQSPTEFANDKYQLDKSRPVVSQALEAAGLLPNANSYYISEVGIKSEYRGQGRGSILVVGLLGIAIDKKLDAFLRTNVESPMVKIARKKKMTQVANFTDPENTARVLFTKKLVL